MKKAAYFLIMFSFSTSFAYCNEDLKVNLPSIVSEKKTDLEHLSKGYSLLAAEEFKAALEQFDFLMEHSISFDNKLSALIGRLTALEKMDVKMRTEYLEQFSQHIAQKYPEFQFTPQGVKLKSSL